MKKTLIKRIIAMLTIAAMITTFSAAFAADSSSEEIVEPNASSYLNSYYAAMGSSGSGKVTVSFNVTGTGIMSRIGATTIVLKESTNASTWTTVKTYTYTSYSNLTATNTSSHFSSVSYSGTAGRYYKAVVTFYGAKNGGSDSRLYTTSYIKAT